jgi:hypothetical protein
MTAGTNDSLPNPSAAPAEEPSAKADGDLATRLIIHSLQRYGGNPELMLKEHPQMRRTPAPPLPKPPQ